MKRPCAIPLLLVLLAAWLPASAARASQAVVIPVERGSGLSIKVINGLLSHIPMQGTVPLRVHLSNHSGAPRRITALAANKRRYGTTLSQTWARDFLIEDQGDIVVDLVIPVTVDDGNYARMEFELAFVGYGTTPASRFSLPSYGWGASVIPSAGLSAALHTRNDGLLKTFFSTQNIVFASARMEPEFFSDDFRAYTGLDALWITGREWQALDHAQVRAALQWVALGGSLYFVIEQGDAWPRLPGSNTELRTSGTPHGFGMLHTIAREDTLLDEAEFAGSMRAITPLKSQLSEQYEERQWALRERVGGIEYPVGLILCFIAVFAVLLGPVNVFIAHRRKQVAQVLWTTPLISLLASAFLAGLIVLKDGFGGAGERMALAWLDPGERALLLLQEQTARTGMLFNRAFPEPENTVFYPLNVDSVFFGRARAYDTRNGRMSGSWFSSRAVQGQLIQRVETTRERIDILPPEAPGNPPAIQSALGIALRTLFFLDADGRWWTAENLRPGERQVLNASAEADFRTWWKQQRAEAGGVIGQAMDRAGGPGNISRNRFYAEAVDSPGFMVQTLPGIDWKSNKVILVGPAEVQP